MFRIREKEAEGWGCLKAELGMREVEVEFYITIELSGVSIVKIKL